MVILDTSVWIEFFKGTEQYYNEVLNLIESRSVKTIDPIFGELLQGALSKREKEFIMEFWTYVDKIEITDLFLKSGEFSFDNKLVSRGIKLIDASIIYCTINSNSKLWTFDKKIIDFIDNKYLYK